METTLRNASLGDLAALLERQKDAKRDVVVHASQIRSEGGLLVVPGMDTALGDDGVDLIDGRVRPSDVCDEGLADKLGIPVAYLRRVRASDLTVPDYAPMRDVGVMDDGPLIDGILNAHLQAYGKNVLVRCFKGVDEPDGDGIGIGRAVLSQQFGIIDNLDVLYAILEAARSVSTDVQVSKVDLSERAMRLHLVAPQIVALAPVLTRNYRSPFRRDGEPSPVVSAGLSCTNSETGGAAFQVVPRFVMRVCDNGLVRTVDAVRQVHLGGKLEAGIVRWSASTQAKNLDLIAAKTRDAVTTFLDVDYMKRAIEEIEERADVPVGEPTRTVEVIAQRLRYSEGERETLLAHFVQGGQGTAGGILNAVTSLAQVVDDPDRAAEIEAGALDAFALAVRS